MTWDEELGYDLDDPDTFDECTHCEGMGIVPKRKESKDDI